MGKRALHGYIIHSPFVKQTCLFHLCIHIATFHSNNTTNVK